jgi:hypothetical protein
MRCIVDFYFYWSKNSSLILTNQKQQQIETPALIEWCRLGILIFFAQPDVCTSLSAALEPTL